MTELYVYYKVPVAEQAEAERQVLDHQALLRQQLPGLRARLLEGADSGSASPLLITWMETYSHPAGLDAAAQAHILDVLRDCPSQRAGERHVEGFRPLGGD
ncbi:MAG: DUF4936 family protein [Burkholderiales bacterium]